MQPRVELSPKTADVVSGSMNAHVTTKDTEKQIAEVLEPRHVIHSAPEDSYFQRKFTDESLV